MSNGRPRLLLSGASGLIGSAFRKAYANDYDIVMVVRTQTAISNAKSIYWPDGTSLPADQLTGFDIVLHLAGESILGRWTAEKKKRLADSRVKRTQSISKSLSNLAAGDRPKVFICASAIGYYGSTTETTTEEATAGDDFLAKLCVDWEKAAQLPSQHGIRCAQTRFGIVLSAQGGALRQMLTPFRLGVGGKIGNGKQIMSWIALDDVVSALHWVIKTPSLSGPINVTAPKPLSNDEFTKCLAKTLDKPALLPVPAFALKLALGEMAERLLLSGQRVIPEKLLQSGFQFGYQDLESALQYLL